MGAVGNESEREFDPPRRAQKGAQEEAQENAEGSVKNRSEGPQSESSRSSAGPDQEGAELFEVLWEASLPAGETLSDEAVIRAAQAALHHGGRAGCGLALVFLSDQDLTRMHAEHLNDPTPTDVITFDLGSEQEGGDAGPIGELYVSVDRALELSRERGVAFERELLLYVVHGTLHLCGYDDHEPADRAAMRIAEAEVMCTLGYESDDAPHDTSHDD